MAAVATTTTTMPEISLRRSLRSPVPMRKRPIEEQDEPASAYATRSKALCIEWAPISGALGCMELIEAAIDEEEPEDADYVPAEEVHATRARTAVPLWAPAEGAAASRS